MKIKKLIIGIPLLVIGISLILIFWYDVVSLFRGAIGFVLAFGGLLVLYTIKD